MTPETFHAHCLDVHACEVAIGRQLNNHSGTARGQVDAGEGLFGMTQRRLLHQCADLGFHRSHKSRTDVQEDLPGRLCRRPLLHVFEVGVFWPR